MEGGCRNWNTIFQEMLVVWEGLAVVDLVEKNCDTESMSNLEPEEFADELNEQCEKNRSMQVDAEFRAWAIG